MTAKEYLKQARTLDTAINARIRELHQLELNSLCVQSVAISERVKNNSENSSNKIVDKIIDLQNEINTEIDELVDLKKEIRNKIAKTYNPIFISVLTDRHINSLTFEKIAENNGKDYSTICRWYGEALQAFRKENGMR